MEKGRRRKPKEVTRRGGDSAVGEVDRKIGDERWNWTREKSEV